MYDNGGIMVLKWHIRMFVRVNNPKNVVSNKYGWRMRWVTAMEFNGLSFEPDESTKWKKKKKNSTTRISVFIILNKKADVDWNNTNFLHCQLVVNLVISIKLYWRVQYKLKQFCSATAVQLRIYTHNPYNCYDK